MHTFRDPCTIDLVILKAVLLKEANPWEFPKCPSVHTKPIKIPPGGPQEELVKVSS
jgi:hypothetical protein